MVEAIEAHLRAELLGDREVVVRGTPLTVEGLLEHSARTAKRFAYGGEALFAVSAAVTGPVLTVDDLLATANLRTRSRYASATVRALESAGFLVLPTFHAPHVSIVWPKYDAFTAEVLIAVLGPVKYNPHHEGRPS